MCLMLYLATPRPLVGAPPHPLEISVVAPALAMQVRGALAPPHLALVTVDGCSCAFPSLVDGPAEYFDGLLGDPVEHARGAACVRALLELIERAAAPGDAIELLPTGAGCEADPPRGRIEIRSAAIDPERFWFAEGSVHQLRI